MTVDTEQIRRSAQHVIDSQRNEEIPDALARYCLDLLDELDQLERQRNSLAATLQMVDDKQRETA